MDLGSREVKRGDRPIALTPREFSILELLMRTSPRVVPREMPIQNIWGDHPDVESNTLDAFIRLLRSKIEGPGQSKLVHTIRGVGYTLRQEGA